MGATQHPSTDLAESYMPDLAFSLEGRKSFDITSDRVWVLMRTLAVRPHGARTWWDMRRRLSDATFGS